MAKEDDVVLIYFDEKPAIFARIESIEPDIKKNWYHITLLVLTIPMQTVTWILRDVYIDGSPFTMDGKPVRIEAVKKTEIEKEPEENPNSAKEKKGPDGPGKVIQFIKNGNK